MVRRSRARERGPADAAVVAAATDLLEARPGRPWEQVTALYERGSTIHGGGRTWALTCRVRLEGVQGGRFYTQVVLWSGDPEAARSSRRVPAPDLLEFVERVQRRVRAVGLAGRFQPGLDHCPGSFSRWFHGNAALDRALASLDRLERSLGAVAMRGEPANA